MENLRIGLLGAGVIAHRHAQTVVSRGGSSVEAIADPSLKARQDLKAAVPAIGRAVEYDSLDLMLNDISLDAVIISTPHFLHCEHACKSLEAGLHVMLEKPLAMTSSEARDIVSARDSAEKILLVAYQRRYNPMYRWVRDAIGQGKIGELQFVHALLCDNTISTADDWRMKPELAGGGHPFDSGGHLFDFILFASGLKPYKANYFESNLGQKIDVNATLAMEFAGGALASVGLVGNAPGRWIEEIDFFGSEGHISMKVSNYTGPLYPAVTLTDFDLRVHRIDNIPGQSEPEKNFCDAITGADSIWSPAEAGLNVLLLTEAARKSARQGKSCLVEHQEEPCGRDEK